MNRRRWIRNVAGTTLLLMMTPNHFNRLFGAENSVKSHNGKIETRSFDDISITWIRDNAKEGFMNNSLFSDFDQEILSRVSPDGKMPSTVSCYLLQTEGKNILFDTGNGAEDSLLLKALESLSITPNDINAIFLTHLHGDHIGGLVKDGKPVFEKASVFISTPEYDGWMNMEEERKNKTFAILETYKNKIHLFNFSDTLPYGIVALDASGHTPGHTIYRIGNCMIVGDLLHAVALQLEYPDACAAYDMDKEKAIGSRKKYLQYIKDENLVFAGMHLPSPVFREFEKD